jgi:hypothetical protein
MTETKERTVVARTTSDPQVDSGYRLGLPIAHRGGARSAEAGLAPRPRGGRLDEGRAYLRRIRPVDQLALRGEADLRSDVRHPDVGQDGAGDPGVAGGLRRRGRPVCPAETQYAAWYDWVEQKGLDPNRAQYGISTIRWVIFISRRFVRQVSVRIVWAIATDQGPTDIDRLDALITNAKKNQLIPMIDLHDATGNWDGLHELVSYWVQPVVVSVARQSSPCYGAFTVQQKHQGEGRLC